MLPNISRSKITSVIKTGDALNNGQKFKPKGKANGNELICLVLKQTHNNHWAAENIPLDIVYEDEDILIINKQKHYIKNQWDSIQLFEEQQQLRFSVNYFAVKRASLQMSSRLLALAVEVIE